jgi:hypothetical protein
VREHHGIEQAEARGHARGQQRRDPGQHIGAEEDAAEHGGLDAVAEMEPVGEQALTDEAAREGIEREEAAQLEDDVAGGAEAQPAPRRRRLRRLRAARLGDHLDPARQAGEKQEHDTSDARVAHDHDAVAGQR